MAKDEKTKKSIFERKACRCAITANGTDRSDCPVHGPAKN